MLFAQKIYVLDVLWPPANDHLSLSTELSFVPIIAIDEIGCSVRCLFSILAKKLY